ncbi:hypothetical protein NDGK_02868 [Clostridiales bacterium CHKCI001]|nr:hypothetical protein NDGK_02868 [Clostridiales bacterium CHKCI001]
MYVFDYETFDDPSYTRTTYAIKCFDNDKYLIIQNYFKEDAEKPYYNLEGSNYNIQAEADTVNWNEWFYIDYYQQSGTYVIFSHLSALRDNPDFSLAPVRMENNQLYSNSNNQREY